MPQQLDDNTGQVDWFTTDGTATNITDGFNDLLLRQMTEQLMRQERQRFAFGEFKEVIKMPDKEKTEEKKFENFVRNKIQDGDHVTAVDMKKYLGIVRKKRHIERVERDYLHRVRTDAKGTDSVDVDDLVPA